jgi:hypothetical protein
MFWHDLQQQKRRHVEGWKSDQADVLIDLEIRKGRKVWAYLESVTITSSWTHLDNIRALLEVEGDTLRLECDVEGHKFCSKNYVCSQVKPVLCLQFFSGSPSWRLKSGQGRQKDGIKNIIWTHSCRLYEDQFF